jgi:hypothetical protein
MELPTKLKLHTDRAGNLRVFNADGDEITNIISLMVDYSRVDDETLVCITYECDVEFNEVEADCVSANEA